MGGCKIVVIFATIAVSGVETRCAIDETVLAYSILLVSVDGAELLALPFKIVLIQTCQIAVNTFSLVNATGAVLRTRITFQAL